MNGLPFKSVAVALLFCVFLGPIGVLYTSVISGIIMIFLGLLLIRAKLLGLLILLWLISCVVGVVCANRVNKKILQSYK